MTSDAPTGAAAFRLPEPWPRNPWPTRFRTVRASEPGRLIPDGLRILTVNSPALGGRGDLAVHLPLGVERATDVPLVVLLHGVYGSFWNWALLGEAPATLDRLVREGRVRPMVLAMPSDGLAGEGTAYLRQADADHESWVLDDVVDAVREMVPAVSDGSPLFLGGNSMGGFGAARLTLRRRRPVAGIAMHSAITHLDQLAEFTVDDVGELAGLPAAERDLTSSLVGDAGPLPPLWIDCGRSDPLLPANRELHERLVAAGVAHHYEEFDGEHDWVAWSVRIEHGLTFFDEVLTARETDRASGRRADPGGPR